MGNFWRYTAAFVAFGFCFWLITFIVQWHIETGWQMYWLDAAIRAWANFAMLRWLYDYQGLVAGILTTLGAGSALLAIFFQRQWQLDAELVTRREDAKEVLETTRLLISDVGETAITQGLASTYRKIDAVRTQTTALTRVSPGLADIVRISMSIIEMNGRAGNAVGFGIENGAEFNISPEHHALYACKLLAGFFDNADRLLQPDGRFVFVKQPASWGNKLVSPLFPIGKFFEGQALYSD